MKKLVLVLMALAIMVALTGCSSKEEVVTVTKQPSVLTEDIITEDIITETILTEDIIVEEILVGD